MVVKYFGIDFLKTKLDALDGKVYVAWTENSALENPFTVKVSKSGLNFSGTLSKEIQTQRDLQDLARLITDSWKEHEKLAPKLFSSLSGH